jgi:hypothetical protein
VVLAKGAGLALQVRSGGGGSWRNQLANVVCDRRGADASGSRRPAFTCCDDPASPAVHICQQFFNGDINRFNAVCSCHFYPGGVLLLLTMS